MDRFTVRKYLALGLLILLMAVVCPLSVGSQEAESGPAENTLGEGLQIIKEARENAPPTPGPVSGEDTDSAEPASDSMPQAPDGADAEAVRAERERAILAPEKEPYDPAGKRDPFKPFIRLIDIPSGPAPVVVPPIQRYALDQFRISGIVTMGGEPQAMVVDPEGNTYFLGAGDKIGNKQGEILEVRGNGLLVQETTKLQDVYGEEKIEIKKSVLAFQDEE